ncbi:hypothetical protein [Anaeromassilibacillus senegalensis]|uniref:hypothetical protein n=1 Tax=Anaeromassilibacillus senegalensis TaxID=1673717 RepID=UPI0012B67573|nr:hypothetical protein [Anaeromassilibacillus senegalensis]
MSLNLGARVYFFITLRKSSDFPLLNVTKNPYLSGQPGKRSGYWKTELFFIAPMIYRKSRDIHAQQKMDCCGFPIVPRGGFPESAIFYYIVKTEGGNNDGAHPTQI